MINRCIIVPALFFLVLILGLNACSKVGSVEASKQAPATTPYSMPAQAYIGLANRQVGEERSALMVMAAGRAIYDGQWEMGQQWLNELNNLSPLLLSEKKVLLAKVAILRDRPQDAIAELSTVKAIHTLPLFYQIQYHDMLAHAYHVKGRLAESVGERMILDNLLTSASEKIRNQRLMWLTLTSLPQAELNTMLVEWSPTPEWQGWLKLAMIAKMQGLDREALVRRLQEWRGEFPRHSANGLLPASLAMGQLALYPTPHRVALLLPMSGPLAGPGSAVYEGFMAAFHQAGEQSTRMGVKVYDTTQGHVKGLYEKAIQEGAEFIVGPLTKQDVIQVAGLTHPVPTILLNEVAINPSPQGYLFGLSPVSEASQVALKARQQGYHRVLVIAPMGSWGDEVLAGFETTWKQRQGMIVDALRYDQSTPLAPAVRNLLQYHETVVESRQDKKKLGSRRQDFDVIFLLAYPSRGREIVPLLRYYYAGNVPVYATSAIYSGSRDLKQDRDLDGVIFCDMPFVFKEDLPNKHWPEQLNSYSRLYALGLDSFALTYQLNGLLLFPALGVDDKSGILYLNRNNQIVRMLAWGQFKQGEPVLLSGG